MELQGKTAIVTGSGRGIGEGIALVLAREGANVVVMDRNVNDARNVVQKITSAGGKAMPFEADVTNKPRRRDSPPCRQDVNDASNFPCPEEPCFTR